MNRSLLSFLIVLVLGAGFAWLAPGAAIQPGHLLAAHESLQDDCLACHEVGRGVTRERCSACHEPAGIGLRTVDGAELDSPRVAVQGLHQRSQALTCALCHAEHAGRLGGGAAARFSHDRLPAELSADCAACHGGQQPDDALHATAWLACGDCHGLDAWTPATFDHQVLGAGSPACADCHRPQVPADDLHRALGTTVDCARCHRTRAWTPADYDHQRYFRFDDHHPAHCADCHTPGQGYNSYSCTGCHVHNPARLAAEHREEGISDWRDCVRCHRSGDEDGAEGGEGDESEASHDGGERHGDDD
ncbi:MAG: hypothetical protein WC326_14485 [Candidatus Delongbacteria bacterium]